MDGPTGEGREDETVRERPMRCKAQEIRRGS